MISQVFSIPVRVGFTILLLAVPFLAGLSGVSLWWILPMAFVFVMADVMGKWKLMFAGKPLGDLGAFVIKALAVQPIVVGIIYLLGRGIGSLTGAPAWSPFAQGMSAGHIGVYALVMFIAGLILIWAERGKPDMEAIMKEQIDRALAGTVSAPEPGIEAEAVRVTPETLFDGHHYSNAEYDEENDERSLKDSAFVSEAEIVAKEAELGVRLPEALRALYLMQNGGSIRGVYAGDVTMPLEDDVTPFSGYEDMNPLGSLRSLHESINDYAYDDQLEMFPNGAKRMIVLAQWYRETLFLDYREGDVPRVGFYDFDLSEDLQDDAWEEDAVFWPDFDAFFAQLYRQKRYG